MASRPNNDKMRVTFKQELFCQAMFEGRKSATEAYKEAYNTNTEVAATAHNNAYELMKSPAVKARMAQLSNDRAARLQITGDSLLNDAKEIHQLAIKGKKLSPALDAIRLLMEKSGHFVDSSDSAGDQRKKLSLTDKEQKMIDKMAKQLTEPVDDE